jgi:hypothetical protein
MHVVISDYWDTEGPELVSVELSVETPIVLPATFEIRLHIRDVSGLLYVFCFAKMTQINCKQEFSI